MPIMTHSESVAKDLSHLHGFNDWQKKKMKKPQLSVQGLDGHIQSLRALIESVCDVMFKYKEYLMQQRSRVQETQHRFHSSRSLEQLRTLPATDDPVKECYIPLFERLTAAQCYKEVSLHDCAPEDQYARRH